MSIKSILVVVFVSSMLAGGNLWAQAQTPDVSGAWTLEVTGLLPDQNVACTFQGTAQVVQNGDTISGTAQLTLVSGPEGCPAEMLAEISGSWDGETLFGTLEGGDLGTASFTGSVGAPKAAGVATRASVPAVQGTYDVTLGGFQGTMGTWAAAIMVGAQISIPTLGAWALLLLATLLLGTGVWVLRRRHLL